MAAIDHEAYPHVVNRIFSYADYDTLLALRGASKTFCDRSDAKLSEHILVVTRRPRNARKKTDWILRPLSVEISAPGGRRLPAFEGWASATGENPAQWKAHARYLKHVVTLDLADEGLFRYRMEGIHEFCPKLATLRMMDIYESECSTDNLSTCGVDCGVDTFVQFSYAIKPSASIARGNISRALHVNPFPRGVRRCVVNLIGNMRDPKLMFVTTTSVPPELEELVLVFHQTQGSAAEPEGEYTFPSATLHCFSSVAQLVVKNAHKVKITLVDALNIHHRALGFEDEYERNDLRDTLVDGMGYIADNHVPLSPADKKAAKAALSEIGWPSAKEYRSGLAPGQWETECVPRPWHSAPPRL